MSYIEHKQKEEFKTNGYLIIKDEEIIKIKNRLIETLNKILLDIITLNINFVDDLKNVNTNSFEELMSYVVNKESNNEISRSCYEIFPTLPEILALNNEPLFLDIVKGLGIAVPTASTTPAIRIDRPKEYKYLSPPHQDYWSSILSTNSVVIWFSLIEIDKHMGFLNVIPYSHKNGLIPYKKFEGNWPFTLKNDYLMNEFIEVELPSDSIIVFSQMLVHKSGKNESNKPRVTIQIRYNDLMTQEKLTSSFTPIYSDYVKEKQKILLKEME